MKTHEILKVTETAYNDMVFHLWLHWCEVKSYTPEQLKKLSECAALCAWWKFNLLEREAEFKEDALPYVAMMNTEDAFKLYKRHVHKLQLYYSSPLIKTALQNEPKGKNYHPRKMAAKKSEAS